MVWADNNFDGVYNVGEYFGFSRANGTYSLVVPAGTHNVRVGPHLGWTTTTAVNRSITIGSGATLNGINFGVQVIDQSITGLKWNDLNGDGQRDANEPAIPGVWIYIDLDGDNRIDIGEPSSQTDKDGKYKLTFPGTGQFTIREVAGPGYVQTFPGTAVDNEHTIVLTGNPSIDGPLSSNLNFGNRLTIDFGDAPQSYGSASHGFVEGLVLGSLWDAEQSSNFSNNADGDDSNNLDDEDGIAQGSPFVVGRSDNQLVVTAINTTDQPAYLQAWADFDGDGVFAADERIVTNAVVGSFPVTSVPFRIQTLQEGAKLGNTVFRFRYGLEQNTPATGIAASGEVEDYIFSVVETLDLAVPDQAQFPRNSVLNPIDVLANDFSLPGETLQVVGVSPTLQLSQVTSSTTSQGGTVTISSNNTVLYTPKNGFIGTDVFSYTMENGAGQQDFAQVTITVNLSFDEPRAIDDSFEAATNSVDFPLNVLANDIEGAAGALTIIAVTQPDKGSSVSIATGGKSLRYTPRRDLGDTEFFTYTVADASGNRSTANVTIHTLPGARDLDLVQIRLVATDLNGNEISSVAQGSPFKLDVYVDDLRSSPPPATGAAAGVFAAYADILYNLQLVSTVSATTGTSSLPFDASFFNGYLNGVSGDAAIPGVIDEFGAFFDGSTMNRPGETRLASITFEARSPGIARFMPDPADDFPDSDVLLFDTSSTAIPLERVRYLGTSIAVVGDGVEFPAALDDSFTGLVQANAAQVPLPVLANDRIGTSGPLTIESVTSGVQGGTTSINGGNIRYTPQPGFNGTDQFTYTIQDTRGIQSTATVTVHVGNSTANDFVRYDLEVTDLNGQSITSIPVGSQFQLRAYVDDLRAAGSGIFAAYQDVLYSASLVSPVASSTNDPNLGFQVQFGPNYQRVRDGDNLIPGVINEIGAVATTDTAHGNDRKLLFTVTMTANSVGTANFASDPADIVPLHDTIPFVPTAPFNLQQIGYGFDSLQIVPSGSGSGSGEGFTNANNPLDVNDDGFVSPIDVLVVINSLNDTGSRSLVSSGGEGESSRFYIDTNADGHLSPIDVLLVINYLNDNTRGAGEGEGSDGLSAWATPPLTEDSDTDGENSDVSEQGGTLLLSQNSALTGTQSNEHAELFAAATDELFDVQSDDSLDDLLEQLAPDIEDRWKKQFVF
jgi:hypothetical protein